MTADVSGQPESPRDVLHRMIAAVAQREYEDSITSAGTVAHPDHIGSRIAAEIMGLFDSDVEERWEVRGHEPGWDDGGWYSYVPNRDAAVKRVQQARAKKGGTADAIRVLVVETAGEPIEVTP